MTLELYDASQNTLLRRRCGSSEPIGHMPFDSPYFYLFVVEVIAVTPLLFTIIRKFVPESVGCNHESRYIEMVGLARLELAGLFVRSEVQ